ncbi:MAG: Spi family protease inhibitor, partial [Candidatus Cloacimonetes bacterium]|nr:Spi family protease inhibitor [Candidatus Cloacimonadota bacterium]
MKKVICILIALFALTLNAVQISETRAECLAQNLLKANSISRQIGKKTTLKNEDTPLAFVYTLKPTGYLVISAQSELPPLMAYSWD